ncbi:DJ-1/PfpI family protein [Vallitaleaceae bacterium 9-2]
MKRICLYIYDEMADFEVSLLVHVLKRDLGYEVITLSEKLEAVNSASGMQFTPHMKISDIQLEDVVGVIIPGGWMTGISNELISFIRRLNSDNKLIASICAAPWIVAKADVLNGIRYTTSITAWDDEKRKRFCIDDPFEWENYLDERVVCDKNIITAKGIAFVDFAVEVLAYLGEFNSEDEKIEFAKQFIPRLS